MSGVKKEAAKDTFDIAKYILAIFVITIHIPLLPEVLNPLVRTAVPLFFMMSSYFFWSKAAVATHRERRMLLRTLLKRNMRLYCFWFVALLPVTLYIRGYFSAGLLPGLADMIHNFLFYSTFRASWYIVALCIGMVILYLLHGRVPDWLVLLIFFGIYLAMCLLTNYYGLVKGIEPFMAFAEGYKKVFITYCNNFMASVFWVLLGKMFAQGRIRLTKNHGLALSMISFALVCVEHVLVRQGNLQSSVTDYYFFTAPLCIGVFSLLCSCEVSCIWAPTLRKLSTVTYVLHSSLLVITSFLLRRLLRMEGVWADLTEFAVVVAMCGVIGLSLIKLQNHPYFRWLKWSY